MNVESALLLSLLVVELVGGAILGVIALRCGSRNLRNGARLRRRPLLEGVDLDALTGTTEPTWPIGGRWPTPVQHRDHFENDDLRAAYARIARAKARTRLLATEVTVVIASALLGFALPADISNLLHLEVSPVSSEGYGSFLPRDAPLQALQAMWRSLALVILICVALTARTDTAWLTDLAEKYEKYVKDEQSAGAVEGADTWLGRLRRSWRRPVE